MNRLRKHKPVLLWASIVVIITALIWGQSLLSADRSMQESQAIQGLLAKLLGDGVMGSFLYTHIRKVAHFTEYAVLGLAWNGLGDAIKAKRLAWLPLAAGPMTAALDELLQFTAGGRSPQISDVLLDCCGFYCGLLLCRLIQWFFRRHRKKSRPTH